MSIPVIPPGHEGRKPTEAAGSKNPWAFEGEVPLGKPMPMSSPFTQFMLKLFPRVDPGIISQYARKFMENMQQALANAINHMKQQAHEAAETMKRAIQGEE